MDLRAVQAAIEGARQRVEALERYVSALPTGGGAGAAASNSTTNATLAALAAEITTQRANLAALELRVAAIEAELAALTVAGQDVVLYDDAGRAILANGQAILVS
jgi:formiminotetrahydrofolate cyclodeaminase